MTDAERNILIVDDDVPNCILMQQALASQGWTVRTAFDGEEALDVLAVWNAHVILLDQDMPVMSGLETLALIKALGLDVDIMFISAHSEVELIQQALDGGADDYLKRPFSMLELLSRIKVRFRLRDLRYDLQQANQKLAELSETDDLTGLFNMRSMAKRIETELERARRNEDKLACIMIDLDHFKSVNDTNDHVFGSFVLKEVGEILKQHLRSTDYAARYGGDEYLLVITETDFLKTKLICERICNSIENHSFQDGVSSFRLTASIGFALSPLGHVLIPSEIVRIADHALYEAKGQGRNAISGLDGEEVLVRLAKYYASQKAS
jgi:two-component system cell cycle response regulator